MLNRFLNRTTESLVKHRTLKDFALSLGSSIDKTIMDETNQVLIEHGFDKDAGLPKDVTLLSRSITNPYIEEDVSLTHEARILTLEEYNALFKEEERKKLKDIEYCIACEKAPSSCVYISVDDIGVKHQKDSRSDEYIKEQKTVRNTVIHIACDSRHYIITAYGMDKAFKILISFLLKNRLMENREVVFLSDGASDIRCAIERFFAFRPFTIYLDWYHVKKKCKEFLSQAIKGSAKSKKAIIKDILDLLWRGKIDDIIAYLDGFKSSCIKNEDKKTEMKDYLNRKRAYIPCYAFRSFLGLINSSNRVEKANDIVVGQRQKHNGMSWVPEGSSSLAIIKACTLNKENDVWTNNKTIRFSLLDSAKVA